MIDDHHMIVFSFFLQLQMGEQELLSLQEERRRRREEEVHLELQRPRQEDALRLMADRNAELQEEVCGCTCVYVGICACELLMQRGNCFRQWEHGHSFRETNSVHI